MTLSKDKWMIIKGDSITTIAMTRGDPVDNHVHPPISGWQKVLQAVDQLFGGVHVCDPHLQMYDLQNHIQ